MNVPKANKTRATTPMPLSIAVLAAGQGKRMRSTLPKVLQPLAGRPLLAHVLDTARSLAPAGIHVVYGHGGERLREAFAGDADAGLSWALQAEQLGTGHALLQAMPGIPDGHLVLVLYGDVPLLGADTLRELLATAGRDALALLTVELDDPSGYGRIVRNDRKGVRRIVEQRDATARELKIRECNSGVLAAPAALLRKWLGKLGNRNSQREYYLTDVIAMAVKDKVQVRPLLATDPLEVLGVNDRLQLATLEAACRARNARALMQAGVTVIDPARIDLRGSIECGMDVVLDANVVLEGPVVLGDGVRVGANSVISNARIGAGTNIKPNSIIENAEIGPRCEIGPFARIRPGSELAEGAHVGNFVELKKTRLGRGSKANHLTYLGDTVVGERVNVGAGTVTCNYDGANKSVTEIGDGAFIGSGSMLVAPVRVGAGATIGAGSTITHDAPDGELTVGRARQKTVPGWQRPVKRKP
jgi:bifunctional UDP-N-acetylglucosamine pyrophosphorylase/glucosamine-1-phosphate N-acetyltransferase